MKSNIRTILSRAIRKAGRSPARFKIVAVGIDHRNRVIGIAFNRQRFNIDNVHRSHWRGSGYHAEEWLMHNAPRSLRRILIARVNAKGTRTLPIHPCEKCLRLARKFNVTIDSLKVA